MLRLIEQLSLLPLSTSAAVIEAFPLPSRYTLMSCVAMVGASVSVTVTVAEAAFTFPDPSVTVRVTVLAPTSLQVKSESLSTMLVMLQLSDEPLSMLVNEIEALPEPSRVTVISWVTTVGETESTTVTVAVVLEALPDPSVPVRVTVFAPRSAQPKVSVSRLRAISQLSLLPLSTSVVAMVALPAASRYTVISCAAMVGETESITVTIAVAEVEFPASSVAVRVTVLLPRLVQLKLLWSRLRFVLHTSKLPLSKSAAVMVALPDPSRYTEMS